MYVEVRRTGYEVVAYFKILAYIREHTFTFRATSLLTSNSVSVLRGTYHFV